MTGLYEIYHLIARTEVGQKVLEYEKFSVFEHAYGSMYLSLRKGREFSRLGYVVCERLSPE